MNWNTLNAASKETFTVDWNFHRNTAFGLVPRIEIPVPISPDLETAQFEHQQRSGGMLVAVTPPRYPITYLFAT